MALRSGSGTKYIFVTGGVLSGIGKGITAASLARLFKARGLSVNIQKCDPYLNTDAGTLNPAEHGEVFVTDDGAETDLDLGHYERFLNQNLTQSSSLMSGRVLSQVISDERAGKYLGKTVQIIPHVTNAIQERIEEAGSGFDVHIVEIGGTVGDYESLSFLEAIREFKHRVGGDNVAYVHVVYLPYLEASKEIKTKPAQNAVRNLRGLGITPDVLIARCEREASNGAVEKLSMYSDIRPEGIKVLPTVKSVYEVPLRLRPIDEFLLSQLSMPTKTIDLKSWERLLKVVTNKDLPTARIGIIAKYMAHEDTYMSVFEALKAAGWRNRLQVDITWINAEDIEKNGSSKYLKDLDGIVVPGGFGSRGIEGKIAAAAYARKHKVPYLGLCLGMQMAVVALAREAVGKRAHSLEMDPDTPEPVISLMADQEDIIDLGGTMRLGSYECKLAKGTKSRELYGAAGISERHRHRYEFNNAYRDVLQAAGLVIAGTSPDDKLVELIELADHPFYVASQFHPEFKSRPDVPHPLFAGFIEAIEIT